MVAADSLPADLKPGDPLPGGGFYVGPGPEPNVGKKAPDLEFFDAERKPVRLSRFRDKLVVLDLGGVTCGPCLRLLPELVKLETDYAGKGVVVVSVFDGDSADAVDGWLKKRGPKGLTHYFHPGDNSPPSNCVRGQLDDWGGIPITYLIGRDGTFVYRHSGYEERKDKGLPGLRQALDAALSPPKGPPPAGK